MTDATLKIAPKYKVVKYKYEMLTHEMPNIFVIKHGLNMYGNCQLCHMCLAPEKTTSLLAGYMLSAKKNRNMNSKYLCVPYRICMDKILVKHG